MSKNALLEKITADGDFIKRHIGISKTDEAKMLAYLKLDSLEQLIDETLPASIRPNTPLSMKKPMSEAKMLRQLKAIAEQNTPKTQLIGQGYYGTHTPAPILRNLLENPGWYTAYTPYQPEISQGRLTALLNFQQMVLDLTKMAVANASLLDEATAAAEAMALCKRGGKNKSQAFFAASHLHPQTLAVLQTRAHFMGIELIIDDVKHANRDDVFGILVQYPSSQGDIIEIKSLIETAHQEKRGVVVACDLLALTLLTPPGEFGADIVIGSAQRFGVPMGYGGPHAAFMATSDALKRTIPGRVIGVSKDSKGKVALRMAMQTREQHIRREKATSNICTAQALLANMAAFYAIYHGEKGLRKIARRVHHLTALTAFALKDNGIRLINDTFFDTLTLATGKDTQHFYQKALAAGFNLRLYEDKLGISLDETTRISQINTLLSALFDTKIDVNLYSDDLAANEFRAIPIACQRQSRFLTHAVFKCYKSETQLMRYMKQLENKDFSLTHGMIPLGSCTMKLNAAAEIIPVSWEAFNQIHPYAPSDQTKGYQILASALCDMLCDITGYEAISLQPNSGAQGEYAGLISIQRYHQAKGEGHRNVCLIPQSAHGTNPASAAMLSLQIVGIKCDEKGNIDIEDLSQKIALHQEKLACIMITYPSTHGVFEEKVQQICTMVHQAGGQVYLDGANMNAQVGLTNPAFIGSDVSHLNLHKTFCIPHGGGGPGMGPIGVKKHLAPFLPQHLNHPEQNKDQNEMSYAVSASALGSASLLPISWAYISMMGSKGLTKATQIAILSANYIMARLKAHYPILYRGHLGRIAHECIIDMRPLKAKTGVTEEDIAKRLMDYGFHAPTMSFPVTGTLMIEPTESEDKNELDRFCDAMISIRNEINLIKQGVWSKDNNPLSNAPHTQADLYQGPWDKPYSIEIACFPSDFCKKAKYWPTVNRVDNVYGDRNLCCACPDMDLSE